MARRPQILLVGIVTLCLGATACGARLTPEQRRLAVGELSAGGGTSTGSTATGPVQTAGPTAGPAAAGNAGTTAGNAAGGSAGSPSGQQAGAGGGACTGTKGSSDVGVTPADITVANIADVSGPVPGIFQSAQQATQAFANYWNATHGGICGRKLKVMALDDRSDSGGYRDQLLKACSSTFASVGSMSAFDDTAPTAGQCGLPDFSAAAVTLPHENNSTTYAANSTRIGVISSTVPGYFATAFPQAVSKAAFLYINVGASIDNALADVKAYEKYGHGWNFIYTQAIDVSAFNYSPYVQQMKSKGVRFVQFLGAYQEAVHLAQAMQQQGFKPDAFLLDPTGYNKDYVSSVGSAGDGTYVYTDAALFEEASGNPELATYLSWLQKTVPGAVPSYFGMFAWSAARMFATLAEQVGANLTRKAILAKAAQLTNWDGNGITSVHNVASRLTSECFAIIQLQGGTWHRVQPPGQGYACNPLVRVDQ